MAFKPVTFPLYFDRWISATRHMPLAARAVYLDWLIWCWAKDRPLPLDAKRRAQIAACSVKDMRAAWRDLEEHWRRTRSGYVNDSLEAKRQEHRDFYASQREKAIKGAAARWGKRHTNMKDAPANAPANAWGMPRPMPSISILEDQDHLSIPILTEDPNLPKIDPQCRKFTALARGASNGHNPRALRKIAYDTYDATKPMSENTACVKDAAHAAHLEFSGSEIHKVMSQAEARALKRRKNG